MRHSCGLLSFQALLALFAVVAVGRVASAQVDPAVAAEAGSLTVTSGDTPHPVGEEIGKLDSMRARLLAAIAAKTDAGNFDLREELKTLEKLDRYSARLADLVAIQRPNAKETIGWLQANAAVVGTWREAYTSTGPFGDNTRLAELAAIETRLGRKIGGGMAGDIRGLRNVAESAANSEAMENLGRRVRMASGLVAAERGLISLGLKVQPAVVDEGTPVQTITAVALGGERDPAAGVVGRETEQVIYELNVSGPQNFGVGSLTKMYAPGSAIGTVTYFTIQTKNRPAGVYTATLTAIDATGKSMTATDTFEIRAKPVAAITPPTGPISPNLVVAFTALGKSLNMPGGKFFSTRTGEPATTYSWGGMDAPEGTKDHGNINIQSLKDWQSTFDNYAKNPKAERIKINGHDAILVKDSSSTSGNPTADIVWVTNDRYVHVYCSRWTGSEPEHMAACEKSARELAQKLSEVIVETDSKDKAGS